MSLLFHWASSDFWYLGRLMLMSPKSGWTLHIIVDSPPLHTYIHYIPLANNLFPFVLPWQLKQ